MSTKDKIKVALFIGTMVAISFGSMYYGYRHPEIYIQPGLDSWRMVSTSEKNIPNYCPPDPRRFTVFEDRYWCIA